MNEQQQQALLRTAARRAESDPFFLASALATYREEHAMDDEALASWLGCDTGALPRLGLCRRPRQDAAGFRDDVRRIATDSGIEPLRLQALLREAGAFDAVRGSYAALLAARDAPLWSTAERLEPADAAGGEAAPEADEPDGRE